MEKGVSNMTSDAKIGLLLGLAFIVIIAFLINGLPNFFKPSVAEEIIKTPITGFKNDSASLSDQADKVVKAINDMEKLQQQRQTEPAAGNYTDVRFTTALPVKTGPTAKKQRPNPPTAAGKGRVKSYVVGPGDNLAVIATKVYGPEKGNKTAAVNKIFQVNRAILRSPDQLAVGQKLVIPSLAPADRRQPTKKLIPAAGVFEKVKKFAGKNLASLKSAIPKSKSAEYVVKSGDSLWQIADRFLGNPARYHEIVELNRDIIYDAEDIAVGMRLRLPPR
jgi:nucleoid-associated protein YgaU